MTFRGADRIRDLAAGFKDQLLNLRPELSDLAVEIDRYVFADPDTWCWSISFDVAEDHVHALWNGESDFLVFEDEADYFEDNVPFAEVPQRVADSLPAR